MLVSLLTLEGSSAIAVGVYVSEEGSERRIVEGRTRMLDNPPFEVEVEVWDDDASGCS